VDRLGLTVADDARDDQVGIVECRAERVTDRVAELAAFMDRARSFGRDMTRNTAWKRELTEQALHSPLVARNRGVHVGVAALEPRVRDDRRATVSGPDHVHHVEVVARNETTEMGIHEIEAGARPPMTEKPRLDIGDRERTAQQRVVHQINLPDGQEVRGAPIRVDPRQLRLR